MENSQFKLYLVFYTDQNKTHSIIIDAPSETLDDSQVKEVMNNIIQYNCIEGSNGNLTAIKEARLVETITTHFNVLE